MFENLELAEWNGIVLDAFGWPVRDLLVNEYQRVGSMSVREFQSFQHHDHPLFGDEEQSVAEQAAAIAPLSEKLLKEFPAFSFVIETTWLDRSTFFQAFAEAPRQSETEWEPMFFPLAIPVDSLKGLTSTDWLKGFAALQESARINPPERTCPKCGAKDWNDPSISEKVRDVRWIACQQCGVNTVHSTRITRDIVGPNPGQPAPDIDWAALTEETP